MKERKPQDCESMAHVRGEIDQLDEQLIDLIAERFGYVDRAWQLKDNPDEAAVPWRINEVIEKVRTRAEERDVPPQLAEALWRQMMGWFIEYEMEKLQKKSEK
ncbi:MAG: chorismate mutase [bacterium]|nr:chorismate mutase [bacterium]